MNKSKGEDDRSRFPLRWLSTALLVALALTGVGCQSLGRPRPSQPTSVPFNRPSKQATATSPAASTRAATPTREPETSGAKSRTQITAPVVGAAAPNVVLQDLAGNEVSLRDLRGKAVVLNFWASW